LGEHLVCPIDENGIIAGDAVWMILASQRTKPTKNEDQEEKEEHHHHHHHHYNKCVAWGYCFAIFQTP
jgi:hypothetical protein